MRSATLAAPVVLSIGRQASAEAIYGVNGHAYDYIEVPSIISWQEAKAAAEALAPPAGFGIGHLLTISDAGENEFVRSTFGGEITASGDIDGAWAGFTDQLVEGEWRWIDGTPGIWQDPNFFASPVQTAYTNWDPSEPNNQARPENYLSIRDIGWWNDYWNDPTRQTSYLVEFEPLAVPEPSGIMLASVGAFTALAAARTRRRVEPWER